MMPSRSLWCWHKIDTLTPFSFHLENRFHTPDASDGGIGIGECQHGVRNPNGILPPSGPVPAVLLGGHCPADLVLVCRPMGMYPAFAGSNRGPASDCGRDKAG